MPSPLTKPYDSAEACNEPLIKLGDEVATLLSALWGCLFASGAHFRGNHLANRAG
jgi:hypothetical protein